VVPHGVAALFQALLRPAVAIREGLGRTGLLDPIPLLFLRLPESIPRLPQAAAASSALVIQHQGAALYQTLLWPAVAIRNSRSRTGLNRISPVFLLCLPPAAAASAAFVIPH